MDRVPHIFIALLFAVVNGDRHTRQDAESLSGHAAIQVLVVDVELGEGLFEDWQPPGAVLRRFRIHRLVLLGDRQAVVDVELHRLTFVVKIEGENSGLGVLLVLEYLPQALRLLGQGRGSGEKPAVAQLALAHALRLDTERAPQAQGSVSDFGGPRPVVDTFVDLHQSFLDCFGPPVERRAVSREAFILKRRALV